MLQIIKWTIFLLVTFFLVTMSIVNKQLININTFPLPYELQFPLYALILIILTVGILMGGLAMSSSLYYWKRHARNEKKKAKELEREMLAQRIDNEMKNQLPVHQKY